MMSLTGVLLTYEVQMTEWADRPFRVAAADGDTRQPLDRVIAAAGRADVAATRLTLSADPEKPVLVREGRAASLYVNPYTAEVLGPPSPLIRKIFSKLTAIHRWFGADRENRAIPRLITGVSNLAFLFLVVTGMYLWLPKILRWPLLRARLIFKARNKTSVMREFYWHHVFGIWSSVPLIVVVATAVVFSFSWANTLVYKAAGEEPPARGRSAAEARVEASDRNTAEALSLDQLFETAARVDPAWRTISIELPADGAGSVEFAIDAGNGRQPQHRGSVEIDRFRGEIIHRESFADRSPGTRARFLIRFLHTGEVFGALGQTVAGIVSLTSLVMVWTGLALAYRRLIQPLFRRRSQLTETG